MKWFFNYQYLPKGAGRPIDQGQAFQDVENVGMLPNVGDYVQVPPDMQVEGFSGRVKTRLFRHIRTAEFTACEINIVVEESDHDWGTLIKE